MSTPRFWMKVWDAPTRLFHWAIVLLVAFSYATIRFDRTDLHLLSGYTILALLLFRLVWGVIGSDTSRFNRFLKSPAEAWAHLGRFRERGPDNELGHNAAGGWMVLLMLALLLVQTGTGLFANDDIDTGGPLAKYVGKAMSDRISAVHAFNFWILLTAIVVHVGAVIAYAVVRRHDLVRPMVTGRKRLPGNFRQPRMQSSALAALVLAGTATLVWILATRV